MKEYNYALQDSDYVEYLENQAAGDSLIALRSLLLTYGSMPVLACALYASGVRSVYAYLILLLLCFIWIPFSKRIVGRVIHSSIEKKLNEAGKCTCREMSVRVNGRDVAVTDEKETASSQIVSYQAFGHLLVLQLLQGKILILPSRIFSSERELAELMSEIQRG